MQLVHQLVVLNHCLSWVSLIQDEASSLREKLSHAFFIQRKYNARELKLALKAPSACIFLLPVAQHHYF